MERVGDPSGMADEHIQPEGQRVDTPASGKTDDTPTLATEPPVASTAPAAGAERPFFARTWVRVTGAALAAVVLLGAGAGIGAGVALAGQAGLPGMSEVGFDRPDVQQDDEGTGGPGGRHDGGFGGRHGGPGVEGRDGDRSMPERGEETRQAPDGDRQGPDDERQRPDGDTSSPDDGGTTTPEDGDAS